jgi:hypothetical protein
MTLLIFRPRTKIVEALAIPAVALLTIPAMLVHSRGGCSASGGHVVEVTRADCLPVAAVCRHMKGPSVNVGDITRRPAGRP